MIQNEVPDLVGDAESAPDQRCRLPDVDRPLSWREQGLVLENATLHDAQRELLGECLNIDRDSEVV